MTQDSMGQTGTAQCRSLAPAAHQGEAAQLGPFFFLGTFFFALKFYAKIQFSDSEITQERHDRDGDKELAARVSTKSVDCK